MRRAAVVLALACAAATAQAQGSVPPVKGPELVGTEQAAPAAAAASALAAPSTPAATPAPASTATPAATATATATSTPAPAPAPTATSAAPSAAPPTAAATAPAIQTPAAAPPAPAPPRRRAAAPTQAVLDKLAAGDRAFTAGDLRGALFAYQDAVYAQPDYPFARVKLGRAYLALRYAALAAAQADEALALDPGSPDALELAQAARSPLPARPPPVPEAAPIPASASIPAKPGAAAPSQAVRVFRLPEPEPEPAAAPAPDPSAPVAAAQETSPAPSVGASVTQRYRTGVRLVAQRDYRSAIAELDQAIALDPRFAVAYAARASARFGLGNTREAADDYRQALALDPGMGTPLYGLAECYRVLGEPAAAEMYGRYARSRAPDVREELRTIAARRAQELGGR